MKHLTQIFFVAKAEAETRLTGTRALVVAILLVIGVALPNVLLLQEVGRVPADKIAVLSHTRTRIVLQLYGTEAADALSTCPPDVVFFSVFLLLLLPVTVVILGSDTIARDLQSGTIRFAAARVPRPVWVAGKVLGLLLVVAAMLFALHFMAWSAGFLFHRPSFSMGALRWFPRLWVVTVAFATPYVAIAVFSSALTKSPALSAIVGFAILASLWLAGVLARVENLTVLARWLPGTTDGGLLQASAPSVIGALVVEATWAVLIFAAASASVSLREV